MQMSSEMLKSKQKGEKVAIFGYETKTFNTVF